MPDVLQCPACGTENELDREFCGECGTALSRAATTPTAIAPVASTPTAERRLVSVLFADLVGFTTLSESRDSEDVRELLSATSTLRRSARFHRYRHD